MKRAAVVTLLLLALQCSAVAEGMFKIIPPTESELNAAGAEGFRFVMWTKRGFLIRRAGSANEPYRYRIVLLDDLHPKLELLNFYGSQSYELVRFGSELMFEKGPRPRNHSFYFISAIAHQAPAPTSDWKIISYAPMIYQHEDEFQKDLPELPVPARVSVATMRHATRLKKINEKAAKGFRYLGPEMVVHDPEMMVYDPAFGLCNCEYGSARTLEEFQREIEAVSESDRRFVTLDLYARSLKEACRNPLEHSTYRIAFENPDRAALIRELEDAWNDGFVPVDSTTQFEGRLLILTEKKKAVAVPPEPAATARTCTSHQADAFCIRSGTPVLIEMLDAISSEDRKQPPVLHYRILEDVWIDGKLVLAKGSIATGAVKINSSARGGRDAQLAVGSIEATSAAGPVVPLRYAMAWSEKPTEKTPKGKSIAIGVGQAAAAAAQNPFVFLALPVIAPFEFMRKGTARSIKAGERYEVYVASDTSIPNIPKRDCK